MTPLQHTRWVATGLVVFGGLAGWSGCASMGSSTEAGFMYKNLPVASGSAVAGRGINVGEPLRDAKLAKGDLSLVNIAETMGKVRIISIVPSIDTAVCEQ